MISQMISWLLFEYIGFVGLVYFLAKLVWSIYSNFFFHDQIDLKSMGTWAVISGGSDGIGLAYATELAKRGINLILLSNKKDELDRVSSNLVDIYKVSLF